MFEVKEWTRIEPCVCGRLMHAPNAKFCSWCGRKLADSHDESTVQFIAQAEQFKSAFEAWRAKHQPPEKVAGGQAYEIKWKRIFSETTKRALEHYGHDLDELETRDPQIGTWPIEKAMERLKSLPDFMDFVDDTKKVRITFEYDPDYPTALLLVEASMKPVQWVPYTSEGETREADHSDV